MWFNAEANCRYPDRTPNLITTTGVIPARVAGIHRAASAKVAMMQCRETTADAPRTEQWAPVTSTGVTALRGSRPRSSSFAGRAKAPDQETVAESSAAQPSGDMPRARVTMPLRGIIRHYDKVLPIIWNPYPRRFRVPGKHAVFIRQLSRRGRYQRRCPAAANAPGWRGDAKPACHFKATLYTLTGQQCAPATTFGIVAWHRAAA